MELLDFTINYKLRQDSLIFRPLLVIQCQSSAQLVANECFFSALIRQHAQSSATIGNLYVLAGGMAEKMWRLVCQWIIQSDKTKFYSWLCDDVILQLCVRQSFVDSLKSFVG